MSTFYDYNWNNSEAILTSGKITVSGGDPGSQDPEGTQDPGDNSTSGSAITTVGAITVSTGYGGTMGVAGDTVTFTANAGYAIDVIYADGVPYRASEVLGKTTYGIDTGTDFDGVKSIVATFAHTINFLNPDGGALSVVRVDGNAVIESGDIVRDGEVLRVTATPDEGFALAALAAEGLVQNGDGTYTVLARRGEAAPSLSASFDPVNDTEYLIALPNTGDGTVMADKQTAKAGEVVTLTVTPPPGYILVPGSLMYSYGHGDDKITKAVPETAEPGVYSFVVPAFYVPDGWKAIVYLQAEFEWVVETDGPETDANGYYKIGSAEDFAWFARQVKAGAGSLNAVLLQDLDLSGQQPFTPIGYAPGGFLNKPFAGVFDGGGHSLTVAVTGSADPGLQGYDGGTGVFGIVGSGGLVKDLRVKGSVTADGSVHAGGIIGVLSSGAVENCSFSGTVQNAGAAGGIAGSSSGSRIENCAVYGEIAGTEAGGIAGDSYGGTRVVDCENRASVTGTRSVGGISGSFSGNIDACANAGDVSGSGAVGGIAGSMSFDVITNSVNTGAVTATSGIAGGIAGGGNCDRIENCVNRGDVYGKNSAGGIAGGFSSYGYLTDCMNLGGITAGTYAGGIVGRDTGSLKIAGCYNGGAVTSEGAASDAAAGGIIGYYTGYKFNWSYSHNGTLEDNYNTGAVSFGPETGENAAPKIGAVAGGYDAQYADTIGLNYYAADCVPEGASVEFGEAADGLNIGKTVSILTGAGVAAEDIRYNKGGYPVHLDLWDGEGQAAEEEERPPVSVLVRFNVVPSSAFVTVTDAAGAPVTPAANGYLLTTGESYSYRVNAPGYEEKTGTLTPDGARTVTLSLALSEPAYQPGHDKARPSFGVYITNRDGKTGTQIGNWTYYDGTDDGISNGTYVDEAENEAALITDFGANPLIYSGIDAAPAPRIGVVKKGIYSDDIIAYYNANNGIYPDITAGNYASFGIKAATNSTAAEDPYASNDPSRPGIWALPAVFDTFTDMTRYYYPDWLIEATGGNAKNKPLGSGVPVKPVLAVTGYDDRISRLPDSVTGGDGVLDGAGELQAAIGYLLGVADTERALRNFEGMRTDIWSLDADAPGARPLGGDGSYYIGSVWITPPYHSIAVSVTGGKASAVLTGAVDAFRAAAGETVEFAVSASASEAAVTVNGSALTPADGIYSFTMPDASARIEITLSGEGGGEDPGGPEEPQTVETPNGTVFKAGAAQDFVLRAAKDFSLFAGGVELDGTALARTAYKAEEGSTVITVYAAYLNELPEGEHTLSVSFTDGSSALQSFLIASDPDFSVGIDPSVTGGVLTSDKQSAKAGETVTLTVTPLAGRRLVPGSLKWDGRAVNADAEGKYTFTMPAWNVTLTAEFIETGTVTPPDATQDDVFKEGVKGTGDINAWVWDGKSIDLTWFDPEASSYHIKTPAQLAGLAALVNGLYNREIDTIAGKMSYIRVNTGAGDDDGPQDNNKATATYHYGEYDFAGKTVYLDNDIDMGTANYMPIGGQYLMTKNKSETRVDASFNGVLDGRGHSVTINADRHVSTGNYGDGSSVGFIGRLGNHDNEGARAGGQAVKNLAVRGTVRANRSVGGVVGKIGRATGGVVIENCANFAAVSSTDAKGVGGIVGAAWNGGAIRNCYNAGTVNGTHPNPAGGIAGSVEISIENSYSHGRVTAPSGYAMGIGTNNGGGSYTNSYYLAGSAKDGGWYAGSAADNGGERTSEYMQSDEFVSLLGSAFVRDANKINGGYPVLKWQGNTSAAGTAKGAEDEKPSVNAAVTTTVKDGEAVATVEAPDKDKPISGGESARLVVNVDTGGEAVRKITAEMPAEFVKQAAESKSEIEIVSDVAKVLLPEKAAADLAVSASDVSVKAERDEEAGTYTFTLETGGKAITAVDGGIKVSIPAENAGKGTVAVLVYADGTEEIIKKSHIIGDELLVPLAGSATVKIEDRAKPFEDITEGAWYADAVAFVTARALYAGTGEGNFSPDASMTRAMLVTVLHRLENEPAAAGEAFSDTAAGAWYAEAAAWAASSGIVTGMGDGTFAPGAEITREQLAVMLCRYAGALGFDVSAKGDVAAYTDAEDISAWAAEALEWAAGAGLITGRATIIGAYLAPKGTATRAEVAAILERFIENLL